MTACFIFAFAMFIPVPTVRGIDPLSLCPQPSPLLDASPRPGLQIRCPICDRCESHRRQPSVGTTDTMIREMPFVLFVPVELGSVAHWIHCTLIVHTLR